MAVKHNFILMIRRYRIRIALLVVLGAAFFWHNYAVIPNPISLIFKRPSTELSSMSIPGSWSMDGGNLQHSRYIENTPALLRGSILWSTEPDLLRGKSLPAIVDGNIYVGSRLKLLSLDADTGAVKWEIKMAGLVDSSPAVAGDAVYFGSTDNNFWAIDRFSGELLWVLGTRNYVTSSPIIYNGFIFMGSGDGFMYAIDAITGRVLWKFKTQAVISTSPSLHNGVLYFTSEDNSLYSVNYRTGQGRMKFRSRGLDRASTPVVANGLVYTTSDGGILGVKAGIREIPGRWQAGKIWRIVWFFGRPFLPSPPIQHGYKWKFAPDNRQHFISSAPVVTEEAFYVGDSGGNFYAREALDASKIWTFKADEEIGSSPLLIGNTLYFGTRAGTLYALDRSDGKVRWTLSLDAPISLAPTFAQGNLFVRTDDGRLHAIE